MRITLSIITPVFNGTRFIESCMINVIEQKCPNLEHIIVDGGSVDGTIEVITNYAERYEHIKWVSEKDLGQSDAMNKGIAQARGNILGFLNVDDYYEPKVLCRISEIFKELPEPSLLVGNCNVWDNGGSLWFVSSPSRISFVNLLSGKFMEAFPMNSSGYFYHKSLHKITGLYNVDEHFALDVEFMLKATQVAHIKYIDEPFGNYRYLEGTKTFANDKSGDTQKIVKKVVYGFLRKLPLFMRLKLLLQYERPRNRVLRSIEACIKKVSF